MFLKNFCGKCEVYYVLEILLSKINDHWPTIHIHVSIHVSRIDLNLTVMHLTCSSSFLMENNSIQVELVDSISKVVLEIWIYFL